MTEYLESWRKALEEREWESVDQTHSGCMKVQESGKGVTSMCIFQGHCDRTYTSVRHQAFTTSEF